MASKGARCGEEGGGRRCEERMGVSGHSGLSRGRDCNYLCAGGWHLEVL